ARRRATYILRNDLLEPEALAQHLLASPEAWDGMTGFWDESQADLATAGRALAEQARALAASGDRARAIEQALIALAKHPFLFALRQELAGWQHAA
ncbi:MAG: hypothetical protein JXR83_22920, partial [Deltaproteobacteria bacterium]|nr:hypothetical protein [Deltaproteobacteria bacterium]